MTRVSPRAPEDETLLDKNLRVAVVAARFNQSITERLLSGAQEGFRHFGVPHGNVEEVWVPGAFEIPLAAKWLAESARFDAVVCLGAVIRGETAHFDFVAGGAASGIMQVSLETGVPMSFGVLTTENVDQALERSGEGPENKGYEAAETAIAMANLKRRVASGT